MKRLLIIPMATYAFYMVGFAVFMFLSRVKSIKSGEISFKYFKTYNSENPPARMELIGQHYENMFEVPILFLITCVLYISLDVVSLTTLILAWIFVISRAAHAWIHLGRNKISMRAFTFAIGWFVLIGLWAKLAIFALS